MQKILFVCTGNICRSPTAEGVVRHYFTKAGLGERMRFDSAGTHGYHIGEAPDSRSVAAAKKRGFYIDALRARKVIAEDFSDFDLILALDKTHLRLLRHMAPDHSPAQIALMLEFAGHSHETEVPDPYYGGSKDFEHVLDLVEAAAANMVEKLKA